MEVNFLKGTRFNPQSNDQIIMRFEDFESVEFESTRWIEQLKRYVSRHKTQLERLKELKRYYLGDNNIKYRPDKTDQFAADNRIASDFAKYITIFEQGYMLGNPVEYKNEDNSIQKKIDDFISVINEEYHNIELMTDLSIYGRAYELLATYKQDESSPVQIKLYKLDPQQTFVVYDDTHERNSLFGVNYYSVDYGDGHKKEVYVVYTNDKVYTYNDDNQETTGMHLVDDEDHFFNGVPINEYSNNSDRTGAFENVLDAIDAYDLSQSELANFQQDSNDAILVITGNPYTGADEEDFLEDGRINPNGRLAISIGYKKAKILILDDNPNPSGANPDAYYLKKEYDATGAEAYKNRLVKDILRFTFTPDSTDENFAGTQTGEAMKYKLMASDNYRAKRERLFKKGLMRRLRLAVNIWKIKGSESVAYDAINQTSIIFTPNIPKNNNDLVAIAKTLYGIVSDQTIFGILNLVTGVDAEKELQRLKDQGDEIEEVTPRLGGVEDGQDTP
ncbi:phage portal protein [Streptococcus pluranimalium]